MTMPVVSTCLPCPTCGTTNIVELEPKDTGINILCGAGHSTPHPDQTFARDLVRGRERIEVRA